MTMWVVTHRACPIGKKLADRHYNRQNPNSKQFVPPGKCVVLTHVTGNAVWVTSWPIAAYVKHAWAGAWVNSLFRSESQYKASELIVDAVYKTVQVWPSPPVEGLITFVDPDAVPGTMVRGQRIYGWSYMKAGFKHVGYTKAGLWAWHLPHELMVGSYD